MPPFTYGTIQIEVKGDVRSNHLESAKYTGVVDEVLPIALMSIDCEHLALVTDK